MKAGHYAPAPLVFPVFPPRLEADREPLLDVRTYSITYIKSNHKATVVAELSTRAVSICEATVVLFPLRFLCHAYADEATDKKQGLPCANSKSGPTWSTKILRKILSHIISKKAETFCDISSKGAIKQS